MLAGKIVYTLNMFVADYQQWPEFKAAAVFPERCHHDTKHLCASLLAADASLLLTSLGPLFETLQGVTQPCRTASCWPTAAAAAQSSTRCRLATCWPVIQPQVDIVETTTA
jgi:hypothetical protein